MGCSYWSMQHLHAYASCQVAYTAASSSKSRHGHHTITQAQSSSQSGSDPNGLAGLLRDIALQMQQAAQQEQQHDPPPGANILVQDLTFHPPGADTPLIEGVNLSLPANKLGLIIGRSGSGKTTLLQLLAGLSTETAGGVFISPQPLVASSSSGNGTSATAVMLPKATQIEDRMQQVNDSTPAA
eukprot:jgi/Chrzof1/3888/Cz13g12070.t1